MVAATTGGGFTLEMATRAKSQLILILAEPEDEDWKMNFAKYQKHFKAAAAKGLVELLASANENESKNECKGLEELAASASANENKNERETKCNRSCAIS